MVGKMLDIYRVFHIYVAAPVRYRRRTAAEKKEEEQKKKGRTRPSQLFVT
jgi:hypothetical protein